MIKNKIDTTLIQIIPEYLNIKAYNPDKTNEQTITVRNNCNIPLILYLNSSDSSILLLRESSIKIAKKQKKTISFIIKDKNYSKNKKIFGKPKKVYIFLKNDLIEEKFEITLSYYNYENTIFSESKNGKNSRLISFNSQNKYRFNSNESRPKKIIPKNIKKINLTKVIKDEDPFNFDMNENFNNFDFMNNEERMTESEYLNNAVQDLRNQILYLKQMLERSQMKIQKLQIQKENYFNQLNRENCISLFYIGNKIYNKKHGFDKSKKEINEYQNMILKEENEKLNKMVDYLQKKVFYYEREHDFYNQNNNYNRNKNYIKNNYDYI